MRRNGIRDWTLLLSLFCSAIAVTLPARHAAAAEPYAIHVIMPLSGRASFLGQAEQKALEIAEPIFNKSGGIHGRPVHFVFHDDQSNPQISVQLANQVLAEHPTVLIGSSIVAMCNAMAPLMSSGPVMYCLSPGIHPPAGSYVFTSSVSTYDLAAAVIRYFRLKGWTRLSLITSTDATGQDAERGVDEVLARPENKSVEMVARAHFNPTDVSVAAQIEHLKAAGPQALIAWTTGAPIATIFKGIVQAGLEVPVATTDGNMTYAQMTEYASFLPKELYIPSAEWPAHGGSFKFEPAVEKAQREFYDDYKAANAKPDVAASLAWGPVMVLVDALRALGPQATAQEVRDYIAHLKNYPGIDGIYDFERNPQRGLDEHNAVVTRWSGAKEAWEVMSQPTGIPLAN